MPHKTVDTPPSLVVVAWGQYLHWAHLQFEQFLALEEDVEPSRLWGVACHWLAAEYVVLEGWRQLGVRDRRIEAMLELYPEHCETLRRCRNAVYHFQRSILDQRLVDFIMGQNEELQWAAVLHSEFQRFLVAYPYALSGSIEDKAALSEEMAGCIGWLPKDIPLARKIRLLGLCTQLQTKVDAGEVSDPEAVQTLIAGTLKKLDGISPDYFATMLKRWPIERGGGNEA